MGSIVICGKDAIPYQKNLVTIYIDHIILNQYSKMKNDIM